MCAHRTEHKRLGWSAAQGGALRVAQLKIAPLQWSSKAVLGAQSVPCGQGWVWVWREGCCARNMVATATPPRRTDGSSVVVPLQVALAWLKMEPRSPGSQASPRSHPRARPARGAQRNGVDGGGGSKAGWAAGRRPGQVFASVEDRCSHWRGRLSLAHRRSIRGTGCPHPHFRAGKRPDITPVRGGEWVAGEARCVCFPPRRGTAGARRRPARGKAPRCTVRAPRRCRWGIKSAPRGNKQCKNHWTRAGAATANVESLCCGPQHRAAAPPWGDGAAARKQGTRACRIGMNPANGGFTPLQA